MKNFITTAMIFALFAVTFTVCQKNTPQNVFADMDMIFNFEPD